MRRVFSLIAYSLTIIMLVALAACGSSPSSTGTTPAGKLDPNKKYNVSFWDAFPTGANKTAVDTLTKQYMQQHPNVTVTIQAYDSYPTLKTKLTAALASGKPPALSQVYETWATEFQQSDALAPLQPFITGGNGLSQSDLADFYPAMLKDGQINGTQYMLPFNKSVVVLYYNINALTQLGLTPPKTLQELESDMTKATKTDGSRWGLSYTPDVDGWSILYKDLGGGNFVSQDGKSSEFAMGTNVQYATQGLAELAPLVKSGAIHITKGNLWQNDFSSQKSIFALSSIASYSLLKASINGNFQFNEAPVPAGPAKQSTVLFGTNLALYKGADADTQAAAWDYMKFLTSSAADATFVQQTGYMPIRLSAFSGPSLQNYFAKNPARKVGSQSIDFSFVASTWPAWDQCRNIITTSFTSVLTAQSNAHSALQKMSQSCNSALTQG